MRLPKSSLVLALFLACSTSFADVAVVVNVNNTNTITEDEITRIFMGKNKSFANGDKVEATNLKYGSEVRKEFEAKALSKSSKQVKAYWAKLVFSGKASPLVESGSDEEALAFVAANPEAIAYIDATKVNDTVKVVKVFK